MAESHTEPLMGGNRNKEETGDAHAVEVGPYGELPPTPRDGLSEAEVKSRQQRFGPNKLPEKERNPLLEFLAHFWGPMPIMIWISILLEGANGIHGSAAHPGHWNDSWTDVTVLCALQLVNGLVGWHEEQKAGDAVAALKKSLSPSAYVKREGVWQTVDADQLVPGDLVSLSLGGAIPADCTLEEGCRPIQVDQAALTGESLPVTMRTGDTAKMGSNVTSGECEAVVSAHGPNTFFGKTATLIGDATGDEMGHVQIILWNVALYLTLFSIVIVSVIFFYLISKSTPFFEAMSVCVVILVASIPIAQEVVCTSTMALGAHQLASSGGAIVARLAAIEELAGMNVLCSDKTGTLTTGKMEMQPPLPYAEDRAGNSTEAGIDIVRHAMLASKWEEKPKDAIDTLVLNSDLVPDKDAFLKQYHQDDYEPFDPSTKYTSSVVTGPEGQFQIVKGAPHVVFGMCNVNAPHVKAAQEEVARLADRGIRALAVARRKTDQGLSGREQDYSLLGMLTFLDPPRSDTAEVIKRAVDLGIEVKMITGDHKAIAMETCSRLGMGTNVVLVEGIPDGTRNKKFAEIVVNADGFAEVFPEHKFDIVESLRQAQWTVGMTGDGVNDAPALKRADCGIAVQGATDAARAAADIVLTHEGLSTIITAIVLARQIFQRMRNYIIYRVACTIQLVCFFFFAVLLINHFPNEWHKHHYPNGTHTDDPNQSWDYWDDVEGPKSYFMLPVFSLVLITILNDGTIISIAYDNVEPSAKPEKWHLHHVFLVSLVLGSVACVGSLVMIWQGTLQPDGKSFLMDSWLGPFLANTGVLHNKLRFDELQAVLYLKISISDFLTVFSARTRGPFWNRRPGNLLLGCACFSLGISTLLGAYWPFGEMRGIPWSYVLVIWVYCIVWWLIQDGCKVITYILLERYQQASTALISTPEELQGYTQATNSQEKARTFSKVRRSTADLSRSMSSLRASEDMNATDSFVSEGSSRRKIDSLEARVRELETTLQSALSAMRAQGQVQPQPMGQSPQHKALAAHVKRTSTSPRSSGEHS